MGLQRGQQVCSDNQVSSHREEASSPLVHCRELGPQPLVFLSCFVLSRFDWVCWPLYRCWGKGWEGRFVSNWFQEAGGRRLFFRTKAEPVHIRAEA